MRGTRPVGPSRRPHLLSNYRRTGGEPNAGDHGEGEDGVHHFLLRFGSRGRSSAARRGMLGRGRWLGYSTLMIHSYIVRDYSFSLPSFSRKGASFVCHTNCSKGVIRAHCMNTYIYFQYTWWRILSGL